MIWRGFRNAFSGPTVDEKYLFYNKRSKGFDYVRLGLSFSVFFWHSFFLTYGQSAKHSWTRVLVLLILPMFFALSGFLVSGSLLRTRTIHEFLTLRAVRIIPALAVEVLLSAFLIGYFVTTVSPHQYFSSPLFAKYFLNMVGDPQYYLPGVFKHNPIDRVNSSLWTLPYELYCYAAIALLWIVGGTKSRGRLLLIVAAFQIAMPLRDIARHNLFKFDEALPGRMLILSFLCGVLIYFYREKIVLRGWLFGLAVAIALLMVTNIYTSYLVAFPAAYITVFLGLTNPPKIPVLMAGDYSYGIYLYAAPVQQTVIFFFPDHRTWWFNVAVSVVPICLCAAFSWHMVETHALKLRKPLVAFGDRVAARVDGSIALAKNRLSRTPKEGRQPAVEPGAP